VEPSLVQIGTVLSDDFISRFLCDTVDGRALSDWESVSMLMSILVGGNETTMNLICNLLWRLLGEPARWEQVKVTGLLAADPA